MNCDTVSKPGMTNRGVMQRSPYKKLDHKMVRVVLTKWLN